MTLRERIPEWVKVAAVIVSIVGLVSAVSIACWQRSDTRREAASGAYAAVVERIATVEVRVNDHLDWAATEDQRLLEADQKLLEAIAGVGAEVHDLRRDFVTTRLMVAEQGATAKQTNDLLLELLRQVQRNGRGDGHANGIGQ
jgi:hypothetical protein